MCHTHASASSGVIAGKSIKKDLELVSSTAGQCGAEGEGNRGECAAGQSKAQAE